MISWSPDNQEDIVHCPNRVCLQYWYLCCNQGVFSMLNRMHIWTGLGHGMLLNGCCMLNIWILKLCWHGNCLHHCRRIWMCCSIFSSRPYAGTAILPCCKRLTTQKSLFQDRAWVEISISILSNSGMPVNIWPTLTDLMKCIHSGSGCFTLHFNGVAAS